MSAGSKSSDGLDEATCTVMETSVLEEGYFNPTTSSGVGVNEAGCKKRLENLCRVCANTSDYFIPIFEGEGVEHQLDMKIQKHLPIQVLETDSLPAHVCYQCASTLIAWHDLVTACVEADKKLHQLLQDEEDEEYEDREEKVIEFFNEPPVDSDGGEDFNEPSTSAVVEEKVSSPPQKRRSSGKGKQQRKAHVENASSSEGDAKSSVLLAGSKGACSGQKGAVETTSSTERSRTALKSNHSSSVDTQEIYDDGTLVEVEKEDDSDDCLENLNSDFESNNMWFPNMHSYCKPGNVESNILSSEEQSSVTSNCNKTFVGYRTSNSHLKPRKRVKPHIIECDPLGFPVETENCITNIFICHICGESILGALVDMEEHLKSHNVTGKHQKHNETKQYSLHQNFDGDMTVHEHKIVQDSFVENVSVLYCEVCGKCFENNVQLQLHDSKCHKSVSQPSVPYRQTSLQVSGAVDCSDQSLVTKRKRNVFVCRACRTAFPDLESYQQHRHSTKNRLQEKKSRFEETPRSACTQFSAVNVKPQQSKQKFLYKTYEQGVPKSSRIKEMVRSVCGELLTIDLDTEHYLLKHLRKEKQDFKSKRKWYHKVW